MTAEAHDLTGKKAVVLGANDETAAAIALALAGAGADVAVTSTTGDAEEAFSLRGLRRKIEGLGRQAIADIADLGNGSSVQIALRQIAKQTGRIDIVVVAPHEAFSKPAERTTDAEWTRTLGFNFDAYFYAARAAFKEMADNDASPRGHIIALLQPPHTKPGSVAMQAARAATEALLTALAAEWVESGVIIAAVVLEAEPEGALREQVVAETLRLAWADAAVNGQIVRVDAK